jgi:hypothetical protein
MSIVRQSDRAFGLTFSVLFVLIFMMLHFVFEFEAFWALWVALGFFVLALSIPGLLLPINRIWATFSGRISHVNNYLLLGIFFGLIMFPAGITLRLVGYDPMKRKLNENTPSHWVKIDRHTNEQTLKDMF